MNLFDVYPLYNINIVKGDGCKVWDKNGTEYLDLYGGHAVISIGHAHPHYVAMISNQVAKLGFYSNSVINKLQQEVAERLGKISTKIESCQRELVGARPLHLATQDRSVA